MSTPYNNNFTNMDNLGLTDSLGIQFTGRTSDPADSDLAEGRLYYNSSSNALRLYNGSSWSSVGGGGGGTPSWDAIYLGDKTLTIDSTTLTFALTHATNDGLTITASAGSAGDCLQITNGGSGKDINGTSSNWSVTKAGLATFTTGSVLGGTTKFGTGAADGTITSNGAYNLILETNSGSNSMTVTLVDDANGDIDIVMNGTGKIDLSGTTTHNTAFKVGAGDMELTLGNFAIISNWNTEASLSIVNDTATDIGAAADLGVFHMSSESVTTGVLMNLSLDETPLAGGYYFRCYSQDAGAAAFTIGELGATVIAGSAVGTSALTLTAGDLTLSDGNVAISSTSTSDVFSITDDALLANNALIVKGSGAFTGVTTSSFVAITPTGLSTGTALYIAAAAATTASVLADFTTSTTTGTVLRLVDTGVQVDGAATGILTMVSDSATTAGATAGRGLVSLSADALTTGTGVDVTSTSITLTTAQLLNVSHISGNITGTLNCTTVGLVAVDASRTVTTGTVADDYDLGSFIRTQTINGAGAFTAAGSVLYVQNITTNTSGTITDTVNGIEVIMDADGTGDGVKITHASTTGKALDIISSGTSVAGAVLVTANAVDTGAVMSLVANALTTGQVIKVASTSTGVTSGSLLSLTTATTGAVATNGVVSITASGDHTSTSNCGIVHLSDATTQGTAMDVSVANLTTGVGLLIASSGTGITSGSLLRLTTGTTGAVATNGVVSLRATGNYSSTSNAGLLDVSASATTAGTVVNVAGAALTTGVALNVTGAGTYTGSGFVAITQSGATTGTVMALTAAALTQGTGLAIVTNALTSGSALTIASSSADATTRALLLVTNTGNAGATPIRISQQSATSTNYFKVQTYVTSSGTVTLWMGNGTTANGSLSGTAGDIIFNAGSNKPEYCTGGTNWTALV